MSHPIEEGYEIGLTDELDGLLRSGEWERRTAGNGQALSPGISQELISEESELAQKHRKKFIFDSVIGPFFSGRDVSAMLLREAAKEFCEYFNNKKTAKIEVLKQHSTVLSDMALNAIESTSIIHVHEFTEVQFDHFSRVLGDYLPGSEEYRKRKPLADYWNRAEQIAFEAVEIDFRNRL
jgi:hypothetical protein